MDFLISYRLEQARELLRNTSKNINEVAYETGYSSLLILVRPLKRSMVPVLLKNKPFPATCHPPDCTGFYPDLTMQAG
ncbi:hypothetical protein [Paraflavitalea speifideaquila]|uniref:hypothetical protein n=1 Tax=Paraflavitalea speifideaquila TaxID=3076558 RepID=UPI0028E53E25|nr:hypothetical protein [Paraflavitalea speifideiaquila]